MKCTGGSRFICVSIFPPWLPLFFCSSQVTTLLLPLIQQETFLPPRLFTASSPRSFPASGSLVCRGHRPGSRQLDLCLFSAHPLAWARGGGQGEQGRASLCFWRSPKYLLNCRAFSPTGHLSKAGTSFSTSLGWETGRGREGTDVMHNHPSQT